MKRGRRTWRWAGCLLAVGLILQARAQEATGKPDPIPPLKPPKPVIAPTYWEEHSALIVPAALAGVGLVAGALWLTFRKRPTPAEAPAHKALRELDELATAPQEGRMLSRVSRTVRDYLTAAFDMPREETTTTEFVERVRHLPALGEGIAAKVPEFLRACDERKFSAQPPPGEFNAVARARELIEAGELRRAELVAQAAAQAKKQAA